MRPLLPRLFLNLALAAPLLPAPPQPAPAGPVEAPEACEQCGMDRTRFARSRMLVTYAGGAPVGTCSVRCAAAELKGSKGREVQRLAVADRADGLKLVEARTAFWVIGGSERGVMTAVPKWAFGTRAGAQAFVKQHGGRVAAFDEALALATRELD